MATGLEITVSDSVVGEGGWEFVSAEALANVPSSTAQAIDVGTVKYVSAEAIRILLWVLGFMTFGYGTKEFEVTTERLGCCEFSIPLSISSDSADLASCYALSKS